MKYLNISFRLLLGCVMWSQTWALQSVPVRNHVTVSARLSSQGLNTLSVNGDRIKQLLSTTGHYQLQADGVTGTLYIKPARQGQSIQASITTEHGSQFQVNFHVTAASPQTVLFLPPESFKPRAKQWEQQTPYSTLLVDLAMAMARGDRPSGYHMTSVQGAKEHLGSVAILTLRGQYQGAHLLGSIYQLTNLTSGTLHFTPKQLYRPKTRAIALSQPVVKPFGTITVYEVSSHD